MARVTVALFLRADKPRADGCGRVLLRVTSHRRPLQRPTGIWIEPKYWNEKRRRVRDSHPRANTLNERLDEIRVQAEDLALRAKSAQEVMDALDATGGSFTDYLDRYISELEAAGRFWDQKKYKVLKGKLHKALAKPRGESLHWDQLDEGALVQFERYLRQKEKNSPNTIRKEIGRLRTVVRHALRRGAISPEADPFLRYDLPKGEQVSRRRLSLEEIAALAALELEPGSIEDDARDGYLLAFYGGGARFSDVARFRLQDVDGGRLSYRMMKNRKPVSVKLPAPALAIVEKRRAEAEERPGGYLFPFIHPSDEKDGVRLRRRISSANARVNLALKRVAEVAKIKKDGLSFHTARHSFADHARRQGGDLYAISKTLRHATLKQTEGYLASFDERAVDALTDQLWGDAA